MCAPSPPPLCQAAIIHVHAYILTPTSWQLCTGFVSGADEGQIRSVGSARDQADDLNITASTVIVTGCKFMTNSCLSPYRHDLNGTLDSSCL